MDQVSLHVMISIEGMGDERLDIDLDAETTQLIYNHFGHEPTQEELEKLISESLTDAIKKWEDGKYEWKEVMEEIDTNGT